MFVATSAEAARKLGEDRTDVIEAHCKSKQIVNIVKFKSNILGGDVVIYHDCNAKDVLMKTPTENVPVVLNFGVSYNVVDLYIYLPQERSVKVNLGKQPIVSITDKNRVEVSVIRNKRGNVEKSLNNIPFLFSVSNAPGYPDHDSY